MRHLRLPAIIATVTDDLTRLAAEQCGVFTFGQAEALGYTRAQVQRLVAQGDWVRVRRNAYAVAARWDAALADKGKLHRMRVAAVLLDNPRAVASHTSAGRFLDVSHLWSWPEFITITVPPLPDRKLTNNHTGVVSRRVARLPDGQVVTDGILRQTAAARTLVDLAREL